MVYVAGALTVAMPVYAQSNDHTIGKARVVDGDTIEVGNIRIRLWGIDAPEASQQCEADARRYACGTAATDKLVSLIGARDVDCVHKTRDRYGRVVAMCRIGNLDLGAEMVQSGWAVAFVRYSSDYVSQENEARMARRGLWAGTFDPPSSWRSR